MVSQPLYEKYNLVREKDLPVQEIRREFRHKETERGREVEGFSDLRLQFSKCDVLSIVRKDPMICHRVKHRAC